MGYKWKPNASQRKAFAEKMNDPVERQLYDERKLNKQIKRNASSKFDYLSAGGNYIPTKAQFDFAMSNYYNNDEEKLAFDMVVFGYSCNEKIHHDHIHVVNELMRKSNSL